MLKHLTSWGTCKCGLQCPVDIDKVFNFDLSVPTGGELPCTGSCERGPRRDRQQEPDRPVQQGAVLYDQQKVNGIVSHDVQEVNNSVSHDQQELDRNKSHDHQEVFKTGSQDRQEVAMPNHHSHVSTFPSHEVDNLSRDLDVQTGTNVTVWTQISSHDVQEIKIGSLDGDQGGSCSDSDKKPYSDDLLDGSKLWQKSDFNNIKMDDFTVGSLNLDKYVSDSHEKQIIEDVKTSLLSHQVDQTDLHGVQKSSEDDKDKLVLDKPLSTQDDTRTRKAAEETCTQYLSHTQTNAASKSVVQLVDYGYDADSDSGQSIDDNHSAGYSNILANTNASAKAPVIIGESDSNLLVQSMENYRGIDSDGTDSISDDADRKPQRVRDDSLVEQADVLELSVVGHESSDGSLTATLSCDEALVVDGKILDKLSPPLDSSLALLHQDTKPDVKSPSHTVSQHESNNTVKKGMHDMEDKSSLQSERVHDSPVGVVDNLNQSFHSESHHASLSPVSSDQVYSSTPLLCAPNSSTMSTSMLTTPEGQLDLALATDIVELILNSNPLHDLISSNPLCSNLELLATTSISALPTSDHVSHPQSARTTDATNPCTSLPEAAFLSDTSTTVPKEVKNVTMKGTVEFSGELSGKATSDEKSEQKSEAGIKRKQKPKNIPIPKRSEDGRESVSTPSTVSSDCTLSSLNSSDERLKAVQQDSPVSTFPESLHVSVDLAVLPERKKILQKAKWSAILTTPVRTLRERKSTGKKSTLTVTSTMIKSDRRQQEPKSTPSPSSPPSPVPPLSVNRFKVGDVVWSKFSYWDLWPCQIKNHIDIKQAEPGHDQVCSLFVCTDSTTLLVSKSYFNCIACILVN